MRACGLRALVASALAAAFVVLSTSAPGARTAGYRNLRDFDGDGKTDLAVVNFVNNAAIWHVRRSSDGGLTSTQWGSAGDHAFVADFDGDGRADHAVFRYITGKPFWYVRRSSDGGLFSVQWGADFDGPVLGDFDADGKADIGVYRGAGGIFYIRRSSDGALMAQQWGRPDGELPLSGDWDGDGRSDLGVRGYSRVDPGSGAFFYYLLQSSAGFAAYQWGRIVSAQDSDQTMLDGDFDGDGKDDIATLRGWSVGSPGLDWYIRKSSDGGMLAARWGIGEDMPISGDYDGDGRTDIAVFRSGNGQPDYYYIQRSTDGALSAIQWGLNSASVGSCSFSGRC